MFFELLLISLPPVCDEKSLALNSVGFSCAHVTECSYPQRKERNKWKNQKRRNAHIFQRFIFAGGYPLSRKTITERKCRNVGTETMRQQNREEKREKEKSVRNASVMFSAVSLTLDKWRKCYVIKWKRTKLNSPAAAAADGGGATPHDAWYSIFACTYIQHTSVAHLRHLNAPFASKN